MPPPLLPKSFLGPCTEVSARLPPPQHQVAGQTPHWGKPTGAVPAEVRGRWRRREQRPHLPLAQPRPHPAGRGEVCLGRQGRTSPGPESLVRGVKDRPVAVGAAAPVILAPLPPHGIGIKGRGLGKWGIAWTVVTACPRTCSGGTTPMSDRRMLMSGVGPSWTVLANVCCGKTLGAAGNTGQGAPGGRPRGSGDGQEQTGCLLHPRPLGVTSCSRRVHSTPCWTSTAHGLGLGMGIEGSSRPKDVVERAQTASLGWEILPRWLPIGPGCMVEQLKPQQLHHPWLMPGGQALYPRQLPGSHRRPSAKPMDRQTTL